jgi:plasmid stabilization system protein ParE
VDKSLFHPEAEAEYLHAFEWYEVRSPRAALRFESQVDDVLARIVGTPESFPRYDDTHRFAIVRRFPFSIVFQNLSDHVYVVAVAHSSRSPGYWQDQV